MLKDILSIAGRPGLFKLLSTNRSNFVVESLSDKRRMPIASSERVVSLKEISLYTTAEDMLLGDVLEKIYQKEQGAPIDLAKLGKEKENYFETMASYLPQFDRERVHANEIKKLFTWYNILVASGFTSFANKQEKDANADGNQEE